LKYRLSSSEEWIPIAISNSPFKSDFVEVILPRQFEKFIEFRVHKTDSTQKEFELYGIQLINSKNYGVLYNSVGINGASLVSFLKQDLFQEQLLKAKPDLIILDYGTNDLAGGKFDSVYFTTNLTKSIQRIRSVLPEVCILIPSIQDFTVNGKNISVTSDYSKFVRGFVKKNNVVFYDYFWISGAKKSMKKWLNAGIAKSDQIHLTQSGYVLKGELYGNAILNSFARYLAKPQDSLLFERKVYEKIVEDTLIQKDSTDTTTSQIVKKEKVVEPKPFIKEKTKVNTNVPKPKPNNTNKSYVVRKGDTLSSIARKHNTTVSKIKAKNKLKSDNLRIGQKLILP
jgi:LysM repeat protein